MVDYSLDALIQDCRDALRHGENEQALATICNAVSHALQDQAFLSTHITARTGPERDVIYEDPDLGFCVCLHIYNDAKMGSPHDHGPTWAVYGQAEGRTEMSDWTIVAPAQGDEPIKVKEAKRYTMRPGDAHPYPTGAIHAPYRDGPVKLLRIEGQNTDKIARSPIEIVTE